MSGLTERQNKTLINLNEFKFSNNKVMIMIKIIENLL